MIGDDNDDEFIFNESKARELVYFLLKNDISIYRKLIPEIKSLDSEAFENLFKGIPFKDIDNKNGFDYKVKNKKEFAKLLDKFDNFFIILDEWYKNKNNYKYLKDLWVRYISIENLKYKDEKSLEIYLNSNSIDYKNWPDNIKKEFKQLMSGTDKTRIFEVKDFMDDKFTQINCILEELIVFRDSIKNACPEGKIYAKNAQKIITNILSTVSIPLGISSKYGLAAIDEKEIRAAGKLISERCNLSLERGNELVKEILTKIEGNTTTTNYGIINRETNKFYENCNIKVTKDKIDNLNIGQKAKAFLKCKAVCGLHCALSFLNLGWSIYELTQTYKGFEKVKICELKLKEIIRQFHIHRKEIGILPDDFHEAAQRIKNVLEKIRGDQKKLKELMEEIIENIRIQDSQKNKSIIGIVTSGVLGAFGIVGSVITYNGVSLVYGISTLANVISAIGHASNLCMSIKIIEGFNNVLNKAMEEEKKIQEEIDKLINDLTLRIEQEPKFDLSESLASVSTISI